MVGDGEMARWNGRRGESRIEEEGTGTECKETIERRKKEEAE